MHPKLLPFFKEVLLICTFLFLSANANAANSNDEKGSLPLMPVANDSKDNAVPKKEEQKSNAITFTGEVAFQAAKLPADTFAQFIELYGKDSLLHFVNNRIKKAVKFMNFESKLLSDEFQIAELLLYSKQFNLGIDTLNYANLKIKSSILKLYGRNFTNVSAFLDTNALKKMNGDATSKFFNEEKLYTNRVGRIAIGTYGNYFNIQEKVFDSIMHYYNNNSPYGKIEFCYLLSEFAKNNQDKSYMVAKYKPVMFDSLYAQNNISKYVNIFSIDFTDNYSLIETYRVLAYGLYMNEIALKKNTLDLMYLLSLQYPDGGWRNSFNSPAENMGDRYATIYALWALCEFRDQLIKYKVKPD